MISFAQVQILAARPWEPRRKFRPDERAEHRERPARQPNAENQRRRVYTQSDHIGIDENTRPHDPAHHDHRGVKQSKQAPRL
jgi:hypothetical protein